MASDQTSPSTAPPPKSGGGIHTGLALAGIALALVLFVAVNILARGGLSGARLDLTADSLFTLSPGTRAVLTKIDEPITLRFYYSTVLGKELPVLGKYSARVRDLLKEYAAIAGPRIKLEIIEPVPFSDAEDQAVASGLQGLPLDRTGEMVYFGLAGVNSTDDEERIAFFSPDREAFLEYDLTKLVYNLANPRRKTIGLMSALPIRGYPGTMMARLNPALARPWQMIAHLQQTFDVRMLDSDVLAIPSDVDVLMVVHPANMPARTMYAIDQYVLGGGRALVFVDPLAEIAGRMIGPGAKEVPASSNLKPLFDAWGITMDDEKAVGDLLAARRVNAGSDARPQPVEFPAWLALKKQNFSTTDQASADIEVMNMASAGAIVAKPGATTTVTPLITTSAKSALIPVEKLKNKPDFFGILKDFQPTGEPFTLAARISGPVKTAFPEGEPKDKPEEEEARAKAQKEREKRALDEGEPVKPMETAGSKPQLMDSKGPIQAVVIADADMLQDRFWVQLQDLFGQTMQMPISHNMDLVTNTLDNLTGSNDLIGLRSRGVSQRPFERVVALQRDAEIRLRAKEQELQEQREQTEKKISDLQRPGQQGPGPQSQQVVLSPAQQAEIEKFKTELLRIRRDLRGVQLELRSDIASLQSWLWFFNMAAIPLLVALAAVGLSLLRVRRRKQRMLSEAKG